MILKLREQKGLTLIELLATLTLFALIIPLSSSVIIQLIQNEELTRDGITSRQDLNVMISELRNQYKESDFQLCYRNGVISFPRSSLEIREISSFAFTNEGTRLTNQDHGKCIEVNHRNPLTVEMSVSDFQLNTTFRNNAHAEFTKNITLASAPSNELEVPAAKGTRVENNTQFRLYTLISGCTFDGDTTFGSLDLTRTSTLRGTCNNYTVDGNTWLTGNMSIDSNVSLDINQNFYMLEDVMLSVGDNSKLEVGENLIINGDFDLNNARNAEITFHGNGIFNQDVYLSSTRNESTRITINGSPTFNGDIYLNTPRDATTELVIKGNPTFNGKVHLHSESLAISTTLTILGDVDFNHDMDLDYELLGSAPEISVTGDANFTGNINMNRMILTSSEIIVNGAANCNGEELERTITRTTDCTTPK